MRKAESLLELSPGAPNRYAVLATMFQSQKKLLSLEGTEQNRDAVFETCSKLLQAPDRYAELRFEADMLLSERDLSAANATVEERVQALKALLARYRGTPAEWRSLMIASLIAPKLLAFDLEQELRDTMSERFGGDHEVIAFRRKGSSVSRLDAVFSGTYKDAGGAAVTFPYDRMGHHGLMVFWSKDTDHIEEFLGGVKEQQERFPGRFEVYSFNVDELPDAGAALLRKIGLACMALQLPGGRDSTAYGAYARMDPVAVLVNAQGHVALNKGIAVPWPAPPPPPRVKRGTPAPPPGQGPGIGMWLDDDRYLAQLQYFFFGDFLVAASVTRAGDTVPDKVLSSIQSCFAPPPFRYRLASAESLANYEKAEALCSAAIKAHPQAPDLWRVRNRRTVALIGMWNLAREPKYLERAAEEARATLAMALVPGADVVARFCLATEALRKGDADPEAILSGLVEQTGGPDAPASALAAAAILAIEANAHTLHEAYRRRLLDAEGDGDPMLWSVYAFLRDRHHRYRNFWGTPARNGYTREEKYEFKNLVSGVGEPVDKRRRFAVALKTVDGRLFKIPEDAAGEMLGIIFAEPPANDADRSELMALVSGFANEFVDREVKVVVAFLSDDPNTVSALTKENAVAFQAAMVPGGLNNPLVRRLGILSADRIPNPLLLRPDGTIAWTLSGLRYTVFGTRPEHAIPLAIGINIAKVRTDAAFDALAQGDFKDALDIFENYLPPKAKKDWWTADRLQGRALAYAGLKEWKAALAEIDAAIGQREDDFTSSLCKCHGVVEMHLTRATILEKLDQFREAAEERRRAGEYTLPHAQFPPGMARGGVPVGVYYDTLKRIRLAQQNAGARDQ